MERGRTVYVEAEIAAGTITAVRVRGASVLESEGGCGCALQERASGRSHPRLS